MNCNPIVVLFWILANAQPTGSNADTYTDPAWIEANCTPVGPPVIVPSTKRGNRGGQSIEQEYVCPDGNHYWIHILTDRNGKVIDKHFRPYPKQ